jgi:hypothetical protein
MTIPLNRFRLWALNAALTGASLVRTSTAAGQSIWLAPSEGRSISIEASKPNFKNGEDLGFPTSVWTFCLRLPVADSTRIEVELPVGRVRYGNDVYRYDAHGYTAGPTPMVRTGTVIGNPYIGMVSASHSSRSFRGEWEFGLRVPLPSEKQYQASSIRMFSDFDLAEAFGKRLLPIQLSFNALIGDPSSLMTRLRVGTDLWISTEMVDLISWPWLDTDSWQEGDMTELWLHCSAQIGYKKDGFGFRVGVTGRLWITEPDLDFGERTYYRFGMAVGVKLGSVCPGIHVRFPLDKDMRDILDNVIGLDCSIRID